MLAEGRAGAKPRMTAEADTAATSSGPTQSNDLIMSTTAKEQVRQLPDEMPDDAAYRDIKPYLPAPQRGRGPC